MKDLIKSIPISSVTQAEEILKSAGTEDLFEKAKWNVGDTKVYQGITYEVGGFNAKGTPLWRKKKDGGGSGNNSKTAKTEDGNARTRSTATTGMKGKKDKTDKKVKSISDAYDDAFNDVKTQLRDLQDKIEELNKKQKSIYSDFIKELGFDATYEDEYGGKKRCKAFVNKDYGQCKFIMVDHSVMHPGIHPETPLFETKIIVRDPHRNDIFSFYRRHKNMKEFSQFVEEFEKDPQGTFKHSINESERFRKALAPYATGKDSKKDVYSMTNEQLFKKYKIPEVTIEEIRTKKGREYAREGFKSTKNNEFASKLKDAINKYGSPIKVDKREVNTHDKYSFQRAANNQTEYEYVKGTVVDVTFKGTAGEKHVVSSYYLGW